MEGAERQKALARGCKEWSQPRRWSLQEGAAIGTIAPHKIDFERHQMKSVRFFFSLGLYSVGVCVTMTALCKHHHHVPVFTTCMQL